MPVPAEHRDIVSSGSPFSVAALRMAGPMPARQHGPLAQMPFTGSVHHVSAQEPRQRVTQAKAGGSLPHIDTTLNQSSDAGLLREVTFQVATCLRYWLIPAAIPFPRARSRVTDPASGAIAVESKRLDGLQLAQIDCVRVAKTSAKTFPYVGMEKEVASRRGPHSVPEHTSLCSELRQPMPEFNGSFLL